MDANFTQDKPIAIKCRQGYPVRVTFEFTSEDTGAPVDVSAYSWAFQIATNYADQSGRVIMSATQVANPAGEVITLGTGTVSLEVKAVSTDQILSTSVFVWELRGSLAGVPELGLDGTITSRAKVIE